MDVYKVGKVIKTLRIKAGFTQQELANCLEVTDKAVSKWERGLSMPDISIVNSLADLLNIDVDNLLDGNIAYLENDWTGLMMLCDFGLKIPLGSSVYDKPMVYIWISYFMLAGIKKLVICCSDMERDGMTAIVGHGEGIGMDIEYCRPGEPLPSGNVMLMNESIFMYGSNLTKYFQRAMSRKQKHISLFVHKMTGDSSRKHKYESKNSISDINRCVQDHYELPVYFIKNYSGNTDIRFSGAAEHGTVTVGKGMIEYPLINYDDLNEISNFIRFVQKASGSQVYSVHEIAWRRGYITSEQLEKQCTDQSEYSEYLSGLISDIDE